MRNNSKNSKTVKMSEKNPLEDMKKVTDDVNAFFTRLADKFHITFSEFNEHLSHHPELEAELDLYSDRIDIDVYGKFKNGTLTCDIYSTWKKDLSRWKTKMEKAIQIFAVEKFGQVMDKPVSDLFIELAA